jgi:hypothetical protein
MHSSPRVFRMTESRRMRSVLHLARMVEIGNLYKVIMGKSERRDHMDDLDVDGRIILRRT